MKKILAKSIIFVFLFTIIFNYIFPSIKMARVKTYQKYLALGDSIAYGYGLSNINSESYASLVMKKCGINISNFQNLAVSGMTCEEFYIEIQKSNYTQSIKNTELITVSIGSNELLGLATSALSDITGISNNDPAFLTKAQDAFLNASMVEKAKMLSAIYKFFTSEETKQKIDNAVKSYETNWKKSVAYIKSINPNAVIVATEFYNPYYELALGSYDLGGFIDEAIRKLNVVLYNESNNEQNYKIAKIYDSFNTTNPRLTNVNISTKAFNLDPHPNKAGHELICTKIMDSLSTIEEDKKIDITKLTISDVIDQEYTGKAITPTITIYNGSAKLIEDTDYTVSYSNNIQVGQARIVIVGIGNYEGTVIKTFNIKEKEKQLTNISSLTVLDIQDQTYTGIKITPQVLIKNQNTTLIQDKDYTIKYSNNINVGTANIILTGIGNYTGQKNITFKIVPKNIKEASIQDITNQKYTGKEIKPEIVIYNGSAKLIENQDYTLAYQNNINTGTATITITGKGNFTGTTNKEFIIIKQSEPTTKKDIQLLEITTIEDKIYTGKLITPEVRIKDGEKVLIKEKDYTITYTNNIEVGTAKAVITGIGDYIGKIEKTFQIIQKDIHFTNIADISDKQYTGKEIRPEVTIDSDSIKLQENKDYKIEYQDNIEVGTAKIIIIGIGNYTGTITKTFNIVKQEKEEKEEKKDNDKKEEQAPKTDTTQSQEKYPYTGKIIITSAIATLFIITIPLYMINKKYKDVI